VLVPEGGSLATGVCGRHRHTAQGRGGRLGEMEPGTLPLPGKQIAALLEQPARHQMTGQA
jgi:hypothetical protein